MSSIQNFYSNQTILLTGATGFLGKLVIEKLLRTCYDVKKVYILVRPKRNKTQEQRVKDIFEFQCFEELKTLYPEYQTKIKLISGDLTEPHLGLSLCDQSLLCSEVTCVIHAAADVKFDTPLKDAVLTNVRAVREIVELSKGIHGLRSLIYVSTAFSNCIQKEVEEKFYGVPIDPETIIKLVETLDEKTLCAVTPYLLGEWPNTYVLSKALAEEIVRKSSKDLPVGIVRPGIVCSTFDQPVIGWIDNFHGIVGLVSGISLGLVRSMLANPKLKAAVVPADYVVNNILAAAWDVDKLKPENQKSPKKEIKIFNFTGSNNNSVTWGELMDELLSRYYKYALSSILLYKCFHCTPSKFVHNIRVFFLHTLFSYFVDGILFVLRKPRMAVKKYARLNEAIECISYFSLRSWTFHNPNVQTLWGKMNDIDRSLFHFNMDKFDWPQYTDNCAVGGRIYLLKDPLETVPKAQRKVIFLGAVHYGIIALFIWMGFKLLMSLFGMLF